MLCEVKVNTDAAVVDMLVVNPERLFLLVHREARELLPNSTLRDDVLTIVLNVDSPAVRVMLRKVAGPVAVRFRGLARYREVPNKRPTGLRLLLVFGKSNNFADSLQATGQTQLSGHNCGAAPLLGRRHAAHKRAQTSPFKRRIECCLQNFGVIQSVLELLRQALASGKVDNLDRTVVPSVPEEKNLKVRTLGVGVDAALLQRDRAVGLYIDC